MRLIHQAKVETSPERDRFEGRRETRVRGPATRHVTPTSGAATWTQCRPSARLPPMAPRLGKDLIRPELARDAVVVVNAGADPMIEHALQTRCLAMTTPRQSSTLTSGSDPQEANGVHECNGSVVAARDDASRLQGHGSATGPLSVMAAAGTAMKKRPPPRRSVGGVSKGSRDLLQGCDWRDWFSRGHGISQPRSRTATFAKFASRGCCAPEARVLAGPVLHDRG